MDKIPAPSPALPNTAPERPDSTADVPRASFRSVLERLSTDVDRGEAMMQRTLRARGQLDSVQLLVLQAGMYRYSETVELMAKMVDKATQAVRSTLQSQ